MGKFFVLPETVIVKNEHSAREVIDSLGNCKVIAIDTETTGLSRTRDYAIIISLSTGTNRFVIYPEAFEYFRDFLENPELKLIMWNANFDTWMLRNAGIDIYRLCKRTYYRVYDAMVMHAIEYGDRPHSLKYAARDSLGIQMVEFKAVFGKLLSKKGATLHKVLLDPANEDIVANYAGLDAFATWRLFILLRDSLLRITTDGDGKYPNLWEYYLRTEVAYTRILYECEKNGVNIDGQYLLALAPKLDKEILELHKWFVRETMRPDFNPKSNPQLIDLFFNILGMSPAALTPSGQPQLGAKWLKQVASEGCIHAEKLLEYRDLVKKQNTYVRGILRLAFRGRIHTTFNQSVARTGRLSSQSPNLQNQPPYIRPAYIADPGTKIVARDYDQLEMRILAHLTQDPNLIEAILSGLDIHSWCASMMFKVPYANIMAAKARDDEVDKAKKAGLIFTPLSSDEKYYLGLRKAAKSIQFGGQTGLPSVLELSLPTGVGNDNFSNLCCVLN